MNEAQLHEKFEQMYWNVIYPKISSLETLRISTFKRIKTFILIMAFIAIIVSAFIIFKTNDPSNLIGVTVFTFIIGILGSRWLTKDFTKEVKTNLLSSVLSVFGPFYRTENQLIDLHELKQMGFWQRAKKQEDDDKILGTFNGTDLQIIETELTHSEGSGKNSRTVTDFKGILIKIKMNKRFSGQTVVLCKYSDAPRDLEVVNLEDPEFKEIYRVYSTDQIEARYLLTTAFMERLKKVETVFNSGMVECVFNYGDIILAVSTKTNLFEVGKVNETLYNQKNYETVFKQIVSILEILEHFKLDQKIGL